LPFIHVSQDFDLHRVVEAVFQIEQGLQSALFYSIGDEPGGGSFAGAGETFDDDQFRVHGEIEI